jgi:hypothetical protein
VAKDLRKKGVITPEEQLRLWVAGDARCPNTAGECCPDFGCCRKGLLWPLAKRRKYLNATQREREKMHVGSLVALLSLSGHKVVNDPRGDS